MTLPPLAPVQPTPATPEGFAVAVGRARHRRWQQIGTAACAAILVVASAGLIRDNATATNGLTSSPNDVPRRATPTSPPPPIAASPPQAPRHSVALGAGTTRSSATAPAPVATPSPHPPRSRVTPPARPASDVVYGDADRLSAPEDCRLPDGDWCGAVRVKRVGASLQFTIWQCAPAGAEDEKLSFETSQQVEVIVGEDDGTRVWRWSDGRTFEERPYWRLVEPGRCLTWDVWWDHPVSGDYLVQAMVTAAEVAQLRYTTSATY